MGFDAVSAVKSLSEVVERRRPVATTPARTLVFTPVRSLEDLVPSLGGGGGRRGRGGGLGAAGSGAGGGVGVALGFGAGLAWARAWARARAWAWEEPSWQPS